MNRADVAYRALHDALNEIDAPACTGDDRFLMEGHELAPEELDHLGASICRPCPIRALCREYGNAARPPAGVWAGRTYPTRKARHGKEATEAAPHPTAGTDHTSPARSARPIAGAPRAGLPQHPHHPDPTDRNQTMTRDPWDVYADAYAEANTNPDTLTPDDIADRILGREPQRRTSPAAPTETDTVIDDDTAEARRQATREAFRSTTRKA